MYRMEEWCFIPDYEKYMISSLGRVKSLNFNHTKEEKLLNLNLRSDGYLCVTLFNENGRSTPIPVHKLVCSCFIVNQENKPVIDHINRDKLDNRLENLRWASYYENTHNHTEYHKGKEYIHSNRKGFEFRKKINGILHRKYFKTYEEAVEYRDSL